MMNRMMKKIAAAIASATMIMTAAGAATVFAAEIKAEHYIDMSKDLEDGIYSVGFKVDDVTDKEIFASIYEEMAYDIVDIGKMAVGDTIETDQGDMEVKTLENVDGRILINGGYEQGGYTLATEEDTNGWFAKEDELPIYKLLGQAQLTFGDKVTFRIFKMNESGSPQGNEYDTTECKPEEVKDKVKEAAEKLTDEFTPQQATVRLEKGKVVEVTINYVP